MQEPDAKLQIILNLMNDGVISVSKAGRVTFLNHQAETMTGCFKGEAIGELLSDVFSLRDADSWEPLSDFLNQPLNSEFHPPLDTDYLSVSKLGASYQIRIYGLTPLQTADGDRELVILFRDVTTERGLEKKLAESDLRYQGMFEDHRAVKILVNPETGRIFRANLGAQRFYGYSASELMSMYIWELNSLGENTSRSLMHKALAEGIDFETQHRLKDGSVRDVHVFSGPFIFENKQLLHSVVVDVTKRKEIEEALVESENKFKLIAENTIDGIITFDHENKILYASPSYDLQLGRTIGETMRRTSKELSTRIHPEDRPALREKIYSAIKQGKTSLVYTYRIQHEQGHYVYREDHTRFQYDETGNYAGAYGISRDVTERVLEKEAAKAMAHRAQVQAKAITELAFEEAISGGKTEQAMNLICASACKVLCVQRSGIWVFSESGIDLECLAISDSRYGDAGLGQRLQVKDYPLFFKSVQMGNLISVPDVHHDSRVAEFLEVYLKPLGITAMLDVGIHVNGKLFGVLCVEHAGGKREWQPDEEAFASYLGTLIAQAIENSERQKAERELQEKQLMLARTESIAMIGSWDFTLSTGKVKWSEGIYRIFQIPVNTTPPDLEGHRKIIHPDDYDRFRETLQKSIELGTPYVIEFRIVRTDGVERYCQARGYIEFSPKGEMIRLYGSFQDITEFNSIEQSFKQTTEILNEAQAIASMGSYEVDLSTGALYGSPSFLRLFELNSNTPHHMDELENLLHPEDHDQAMEYFAHCIANRLDYNCEYSVVLSGGRRMYVLSRSKIDYTENGTAVRIHGIKQDITERKLAEKALQESEQRYHSVLSALSEGVVVQNKSSEISFFNDSACTILGISPDQLLGKTSYDPDWEALQEDGSPFLPDQHPAMITLRSGVPKNNVLMNVNRKQGGRVMISINSRPVMNAQGELDGVVCSFVDITESRAAQTALVLSEERNRAMLSAIPDLLFRMNDQFVFVDCHASDQSKLPFDPKAIIGQSIQQAMPPNIVRLTCEKIRTTLRTKELQEFEYTVNLEEETFIYEARMVPCGESEVIIIARDVTQNKRFEEELQKMDRLQSIGTLAGGIAHDFNNVMTGLFANISLAKLELDESSTVHSILDDAEKSMGRATRLTQQLLTFAKGGTPIRENVSIAELVSEVARFDLTASNVKPVMVVKENLWRALVDKGQMQQVFSNLIINAMQAMPGGGNIFITLDNVKIQENEVPTLKPGRYVMAVIVDQGPGIRKEILERIFDPYFTTKKSGTGLGLATVYSIMHRHNGYISVESTVGVGTQFTLYLPATLAAPNAPEDDVLELKNQGTVQSGHILLLDDEVAILKVCKRMLEKNGYTVEAYQTGEEAVSAYKKANNSDTPFDAVLIDLTIPGGMGGKEAVEHILKFNPEAKCVVSSGYAEDPVMANYKTYGFRGMVVKPFTVNTLLEVIEQVLQE